jgi:hypothetical protein
MTSVRGDLRRGRQLLFNLRQNAFHLFFAEGSQRLTLGVTERAVL